MNKLPLFIILLLIGFCISPVSAVAGDIGYYEFQDQRVESTLIKHEIDKPQSSFVFSAPEGYAIVGADFLIPPDAGFNFSMYTDDYVISGWGRLSEGWISQLNRHRITYGSRIERVTRLTMGACVP